MVDPIGTYCNICISDPGTGKAGEKLENLAHCLACDYTIKAYDLGFSFSAPKVPPIGTVELSSKFLVGKEPAAPKTKSPRNKRDDVTSNSDPRAVILYVFDWTDANPNIYMWWEDNPEVRANRYAADLLLPSPVFSRQAKKREITFATVRDLAREFQTSLTATAIRLVELGSFPSMLVCYKLGHRRWFTPGPDVPKILWPRSEPGRATAAYDLVHGTATAEGPVDVYADGWFDIRNANHYEVREDSIRVSDRFVLSLLWWKDESQILDLG